MITEWKGLRITYSVEEFGSSLEVDKVELADEMAFADTWIEGDAPFDGVRPETVAFIADKHAEEIVEACRADFKVPKPDSDWWHDYTVEKNMRRGEM